MHPSVDLSTYLPTYLPIYLSVCLSIHPSMPVYIKNIYIYIYIYIYITFGFTSGFVSSYPSYMFLYLFRERFLSKCVATPATVPIWGRMFRKCSGWGSGVDLRQRERKKMKLEFWSVATQETERLEGSWAFLGRFLGLPTQPDILDVLHVLGVQAAGAHCMRLAQAPWSLSS